MGTDPTTIRHVGPPPWADVAGQPCIKYGSWTAALQIARPWVASTLAVMRSTLPAANLVDIRWWSHLNPGDVPGVAGWHFDCFNAHDGTSTDEHRLYFAGAGCRTLFRSGYAPEECIVGYGHDAEHTITPATISGPRLLLRVTRSTIRPANAIRPEGYVVRAGR